MGYVIGIGLALFAIVKSFINIFAGDAEIWSYIFATGAEAFILLCLGGRCKKVGNGEGLAPKLLGILGTIFSVLGVIFIYNNVQYGLRPEVQDVVLYVIGSLVVVINLFLLFKGIVAYLVLAGLAKLASSIFFYIKVSNGKMPMVSIVITGIFVVLMWIMIIEKAIKFKRVQEERENQRKIEEEERIQRLRKEQEERERQRKKEEEEEEEKRKKEQNLRQLFDAIENDDKDLVVELLEKGADINNRNSDGITPLLSAVAKNKYEAVRILIENGADVNKTDSTGRSPLCWSILGGNKEIAELLIEKGADIHQKVWGLGLLQTAADEKNKEMVSFLIEKGLDINEIYRIENGDFTVLASAVCEGDPYFVAFLIKKGADANLAPKKETGWAPLHQTIWSENVKNKIGMVSVLVKKGANPNAESEAGTPLELAIQKNYVEIVSILLENGADANYLTKKGSTPLQRALTFSSINIDNLEIIKLLVEHGADVNYKNSDDSISPLIEALSGFSVSKDVVSYLISSGADVNHEAKGGTTPLFTAIEVVSALVPFLIACGADVNYVNKNGKTPLKRAIEIGNIETINALKSAGATLEGSENKSREQKTNQQPTQPNSSSQSLTELSESSPSFNAALVALSKIIAKNGEEIFKTENKQKFVGLVSDFLPQTNEFYPKLKQALSCDFTQMLFDGIDNDEDEKLNIFEEAVKKIVSEAELKKEDAQVIAKLIALSLGWEFA